MDDALTLREFIGILEDFANEHPEYEDMIVKFEGGHYNGEVVTGINHGYPNSCAVWLEFHGDDRSGASRPEWNSRTQQFVVWDGNTGEWIPVGSAKVD